MKILLINPPVFTEFGYVVATAPPLGLLYLAGYLEKNGYPETKIIDADASRIDWDEFRHLLSNEQPDILGLTSVSMVLPVMIKAAKIAKEVLPDVKIVAGGFGPTKETAKTLQTEQGAVDFVVLGEGEETFLELIRKIESGSADFSDVKGIAFLRENDVVTTEPRPYLSDLNTLPWPAYHLLKIDFSLYQGMHAKYKEMKAPVAVMVASRGCPHRCTFCSLGSRLFRMRDPIDVVDEIEFHADKFGANSIQLYDDEFIGMSPKQNEWVEAICNEIIKRGLHRRLSFLIQGRCSPYVDLKTLQKMREANFVWIWWGVESGSQRVLDLIKKDIKVENVKKVFSLAKKAGIKSMMFIMVGFPGETPQDIKLTADLIASVKPNQVRIHIVTPYPGSEMRKYLEENNLIDETDPYKFDTRKNVIHHTKEMSADEIKKYYRMLVFRFENGYWYFAKFILKSLTTMDGWKKIGKRAMMAASYLGDWLKLYIFKTKK